MTQNGITARETHRFGNATKIVNINHQTRQIVRIARGAFVFAVRHLKEEASSQKMRQFVGLHQVAQLFLGLLQLAARARQRGQRFQTRFKLVFGRFAMQKIVGARRHQLRDSLRRVGRIDKSRRQHNQERRHGAQRFAFHFVTARRHNRDIAARFQNHDFGRRLVAQRVMKRVRRQVAAQNLQFVARTKQATLQNLNAVAASRRRDIFGRRQRATAVRRESVANFANRRHQLIGFR